MKAISPVIAIVILLLMTVAAGGMAYLTITTYQETSQTGTEGSMGQLAQKTGTFVRVESIADGKIYLRNIGTEDLERVELYIDGKPISFSGPEECLAGDLCVYELDETIECAEEKCKIIITSTAGTTATSSADEEDLQGEQAYTIGTLSNGQSSANVTFSSANNTLSFTIPQQAQITSASFTLTPYQTTSFPTDPYLNLGLDDDHEWYHSGEFNTTEGISNLQTELNSLLTSCDCPGCAFDSSNCNITIGLNSTTPGIVEISNIAIRYTLTASRTWGACVPSGTWLTLMKPHAMEANIDMPAGDNNTLFGVDYIAPVDGVLRRFDIQFNTTSGAGIIGINMTTEKPTTYDPTTLVYDIYSFGSNPDWLNISLNQALPQGTFYFISFINSTTTESPALYVGLGDESDKNFYLCSRDSSGPPSPNCTDGMAENPAGMIQITRALLKFEPEECVCPYDYSCTTGEYCPNYQCEPCPNLCDGVCDAVTCTSDPDCAGTPCCGNGVCAGAETTQTCLEDCWELPILMFTSFGESGPNGLGSWNWTNGEWVNTVNLTTNTIFFPSQVFDQSENGLGAWAHITSGDNYTVQYSEWDGASWSSVQNLTNASYTTQSDLALALDLSLDGSRGLLMWTNASNTERDIFALEWNTTHWINFTNVSNNQTNMEAFPSVALHPNGNLGFTLWTNTTTDLTNSTLIYANWTPTDSWSNGTDFSELNSGLSDVVFDTDGSRAIAAYIHARNLTDIPQDSDIFVREWTQAGGWAPSTNISDSIGNASMYSKIAIDANSNPLLIWYEMNISTSLQYCDAHILYSYHNGASWSTPQELADLYHPAFDICSGVAQSGMFSSLVGVPGGPQMYLWMQAVGLEGVIYERRWNGAEWTAANSIIRFPLGT